jgi:hypothetical protein
MSLPVIFAAFKAGLAANMAALGLEPPQHHLGEEHLRFGEENLGQNQPKPSIVWVPLGAPSFEQAAGMRSPVSTTVPGGLSKPLRLGDGDDHIDAYVWTDNLADTWDLLCHFAASCRTSATAHGFRVLAWRWAAVSPDKLGRGTYCILRFSVKIPITFEASQVAHPPFRQSVTGQLDVDGHITSEVETA